MSLFTQDDAIDPGYRNIREASNDYLRSARGHCEDLWKRFARHADREFLVEIRNDFNVRYWEMYLAISLEDMGFEISCPKPGPDVGIIYKGQRIWFEATCPTPGQPGSADEVPARVFVHPEAEPVAAEVPNQKIVLRYLNSISSKYNDQYANWLKKGIVSPGDAFVVALNPRKISHDIADTDPPRLLQAAFQIGNQFITIDKNTRGIVETGYLFRDMLEKASNSGVPTGVFMQKEYVGLSGLLCSRVDALNRPKSFGEDFQLAPNPNAKISLSPEFRLKGTYFRPEIDKEGDIKIVRE